MKLIIKLINIQVKSYLLGNRSDSYEKQEDTVDRRKRTEMCASVSRFCDQNLQEIPLQH